MKKNPGLLMAGVLAAAFVLAPVVGFAQDKPKAPAAGSAPEKPRQSHDRPAPFRGSVAAVDKAAKTVTVGERTFHISSETRLFNGNRPGTLDDVKVGDLISGNFVKGADGKLTAKMIRFGARPNSEGKPGKQGKSVEKKSAVAE